MSCLLRFTPHLIRFKVKENAFGLNAEGERFSQRKQAVGVVANRTFRCLVRVQRVLPAASSLS